MDFNILLSWKILMSLTNPKEVSQLILHDQMWSKEWDGMEWDPGGLYNLCMSNLSMRWNCDWTTQFVLTVCNILCGQTRTAHFWFKLFFFKIFFGVPHLATCIFLVFYNEPELGVGIDPDMALTPLLSSIGQGLNPQPSDCEPSAPPLDHSFRWFKLFRVK